MYNGPPTLDSHDTYNSPSTLDFHDMYNGQLRATANSGRYFLVYIIGSTIVADQILDLSNQILKWSDTCPAT